MQAYTVVCRKQRCSCYVSVIHFIFYTESFVFSLLNYLCTFSEPLSITCPDLEVTASGETGATVEYPVSASGGTTPHGFACSPPSGSLFSISDTRHTATCTVTDAALTEERCTFFVRVNGKFYITICLLMPANIWFLFSILIINYLHARTRRKE